MSIKISTALVDLIFLEPPSDFIHLMLNFEVSNLGCFVGAACMRLLLL